jgi:hypothetical protein
VCVLSFLFLKYLTLNFLNPLSIAGIFTTIIIYYYTIWKYCLDDITRARCLSLLSGLNLCRY